MAPLREIFSEYRQTVAALREVPFLTDIPCLVAVRHLLPAFLWGQIRRSGRRAENYRCYGGFCEPDRRFAKVPWAACRARYLPVDAKDGYFVVLLFREDMAGCWLSLNRGYLQHLETLRGDAQQTCPQTVHSSVLAHLAPVPDRFVIGAIDLGATTDFGRSYELGASISCYFDAADLPSDKRLGADFLQLLDLYDRLAV